MRHLRGSLVPRLRIGAVLAVLSGVSVLCAVRPAFGDPLTLVQRAKLTGSHPVELAGLGTWVAIDGDTVVGGAPGFGSQGEAYVFVRNGAGWSQQQRFLPDDPTVRRYGASVAVSGDTALVGAPFTSSAGSGSAYVFVRSGSVWSQQARLMPSDAVIRPNNHFGKSVAIQGETILVGGAGAAYVFARSAAGWSEQQKLTSATGGAFFGASVALDGETVVIGDSTLFSSAAFVFERSGTVWSQVQKLTAGDAAAARNFGTSVALDGETIVAGAPFDPSAGHNAGSAYVFVKSGAGWVQEQKLLPADPVPPSDVFGKQFGESVTIRGETILIGAQYDISRTGAAYVFGRSGAGWSQSQKLTAPAADRSTGRAFGIAVALDGETAAIGMSGDGRIYGAVYIFEPLPINRPPVADAGPDQTLECVSPSGARARLDGTGSSDPDGDPLSFLWTGPFGQASGASPLVELPAGSNSVFLKVADGRGGTAEDAVEIAVQDTTAPDIFMLTAQPNRLWPPNHKMVTVSLAVDAADTCDAAPSCAIETVTANEPSDGDFSITGSLQVQLRAERLGSGSGRVYSIGIGCVDSSGNRSTATVEVLVPHNSSAKLR